MKSITRNTGKTGLLAIVALILFSFHPKPGGEGFEVYLNNKLVLQQFGTKMNDVKSLRIDPASYNDELSVRYHHCGQPGKNRRIVIKDEHNKVLKEWQFKDVNTAAAAMTCKVKDIVGLQKGNGPVELKLYYSSSELPAGRQLAALQIQSAQTARR